MVLVWNYALFYGSPSEFDFYLMLYNHYSHVLWTPTRWPNFTPGERGLACPCCGEFYHDVEMFDAIQKARWTLLKPIRFNSGHRCGLHNARVGGAPLSQHKRLAFDIPLEGHNKQDLLEALHEAGFKGFGYYQTFIHVDQGRERFWYGSEKARELWNGLM